MASLAIIALSTLAAANGNVSAPSAPAICWPGACSVGSIERSLPCAHLPHCKHEDTQHEPVHELSRSGTPLVFLHWGKAGGTTVQDGLEAVSQRMAASLVQLHMETGLMRWNNTRTGTLSQLTGMALPAKVGHNLSAEQVKNQPPQSPSLPPTSPSGPGVRSTLASSLAATSDAASISLPG